MPNSNQSVERLKNYEGNWTSKNNFLKLVTLNNKLYLKKAALSLVSPGILHYRPFTNLFSHVTIIFDALSGQHKVHSVCTFLQKLSTRLIRIFNFITARLWFWWYRLKVTYVIGHSRLGSVAECLKWLLLYLVFRRDLYRFFASSTLQ